MVAPFSVTLPLLGQEVDHRDTAACGSNSVEFAPVEAGHVARELDHRHLHAEADAEERHLPPRARSEPPRSSPRCRGCRSRAPPGCRPSRASSAAAPRFSISSESMWCRLTRQSLPMPPWISASLRLLYDSTRSTYLPTRPMSTSACGLLSRCTTRSQPVSSGARDQMLSSSPILSSTPSLVEADRHLVDAADVLGREDGVGGDVGEHRDLLLQRRLDRPLRATEQDRRAGCRSRAASCTECCVGLVFISPAAPMYGTSVTWTEMALLRARPRSAAGGSPRETAATRCRRRCRRPRRSARPGPWRSRGCAP